MNQEYGFKMINYGMSDIYLKKSVQYLVCESRVQREELLRYINM